MDMYEKEIEYCYVRYLYATFLKASLKYDRETYKKALNIAIEEVQKRYKGYRKNFYFYQSLKGIYCILFGRLLGEILYIIKGR